MRYDRGDIIPNNRVRLKPRRGASHMTDIQMAITADVHILHDQMPHDGKYYDRSDPKYRRGK